MGGAPALSCFFDDDTWSCTLQVLTTGSPAETDFRQKLDALNFMMADNHLERHERTRVRDFYRKSKTMLKRRSYVKLIDTTLSQELRGVRAKPRGAST